MTKYIKIQVDYNGKPLILDTMKAKFMGEFFIEEEAIDHLNPRPGEETYIIKHDIPWTNVKEIYQQLALYASTLNKEK